MSGLGLDHVFPFPRDFDPQPAQSQHVPERSHTPQVVIHDLEPAVEERSSPERSSSEQSSPGPLAHVFPWQSSPTPPPFVQMQVFEPLEIGDLTPTPSEWSESQLASAQQSPDGRRKEAGLVPDRGPPRDIEPINAPQLQALAGMDRDVGPETPPPGSPDQDGITTPIAEQSFASLDGAADALQPAAAEEGAQKESAPQLLDPVEESQPQIEVSDQISDAVPPADLVDLPAPSATQPDESLPEDESKPETATQSSETQPSTLIPISKVANRYLIYDTSAITYLRRRHNICGVLIGTLPSHPQQNIFLGTPLELMPEEARRLVEIGVAYIVDDVQAHEAGIMGLDEAERKAFLRAMEKQGHDAMRANQKKADDIKKEALKKNAEKIAKAREAKRKERQATAEASENQPPQGEDGDSSLFSPVSPARASSPVPPQSSAAAVPAEERFYITPSTSHPPLPTPPASPRAAATNELPPAFKSYPLFAYLHSRGYFMTPGLRFGCQYCVYPGDPLRFHSHFLAAGMGWDDEFDLMQLVGGGRLGTGVKKGFLVGGKENKGQEGNGAGSEEGVRAFSIEWSGM